MSNTAEAQVTPAPSAPAPSGGASSSQGGASQGSMRRDLRQMTFEQGEAAVAPSGRRRPGAPATPAQAPQAPGQAVPARTEPAPPGLEAPVAANEAAPAQAAPAPEAPAQAAPAPQPTAAPGATAQAAPAPQATPAPAAPAAYRDPTRDPERRRAALRAAQGSIARIRDLMSYGAFDWAITDGEATEALRLLNALPSTTDLVVVASELVSTNAGARLYDNTPAAAKTTFARAFLAIAIATGHNDYILETLRRQTFLRAGDEPLLVRAMPLLTDADLRAAAMQAESRQALSTLPLQSWIGLTPEPIKGDLTRRLNTIADDVHQRRETTAQRNREEAETTRQTNEAMRNNPEFRRNIQTIEGLLSYGVFDWAITDSEARQVFQIFQRMGSPQEVRMAVNQLDRGPFMDRFLDNLPAADRWGGGKRAFLRIIAARAPERNVRFVEQMLSFGVFDWAVTDEEALMAFRIVQQMPADVQRHFQLAQEGQWWRRMEENIGRNDANDRDMHLYANEGEKGRLKAEFEQQCNAWARPQLQSKIEMLCRMNEDEFVETTLRQKGLLAAQENQWIGQTFGFLPDRRDQRIYDAWVQNRGADNQGPGFFQQVGGTFTAVGQGIDYGITGDATFDLEAAQAMMGGQLSNPIPGGAGANVTMTLAPRTNERDNRLTVASDSSRGTQSLRGEQLNIQSFAMNSNGQTLQAGPILVRGVDVERKWATDEDPASFLRVNIPLISAQNISITTRDSMRTVGALTVSGLSVVANQVPGTAPSDPEQSKQQLLAEVQRAVEKLLGMIRGANVEPDQLATQLSNAFSEMQATVRVASVVAERVTGSDGTYADRAEVRNAEIQVTNSRKGDTIRLRLRELTEASGTRELTADERTEKARLEQELPAVLALEEEERSLAALEANRTITAPDRDRLAQIRSQMLITRAQVSVEELSVSNANASGAHADQATMRNFRADVRGSQRAGNSAQTDVEVEASVGSLSAQGVRQGDRQIGNVTASDLRARATTDAEGTRGSVHVGSFEATGQQARDGQAASGQVSLNNFDLAVSGGPNLLTSGDLAGQEINVDLSLGNLAFNNVNFAGSGLQIEAPSAAINGFRVGARVRVTRAAEGQQNYSVEPVSLSRLELDRMTATGLHVVLPVGDEQVDVRVPSAAIVNLRVGAMPLQNFNPLSLTGSVSVESIQAEMNARIGDYFQAQGAVRVSDLRAEALETGAVRMHLGDLTMEQLGFDATGNVPPDSIVAKLRGSRAQINRLGGVRGDVVVDRNTGAIQFTAGIGDFDMANVAYAGGGMSLAVNRGVRMTGASITGTAEVDPAVLSGGNGARPASPLRSLRVSELRVGRIQGQGIQYANPSAAQRVEVERGFLEDIRVRNFDMQTGAVDFHLGAAGVENLNLAVTQGLSGAGGQRVIRANASARVTGIDVARASNGRTTFSVAGASMNGSGSMRQTDANGAETANLQGNAQASVSGIRGELGADGGVSARAADARLSGRVHGTQGGNQLDVNAQVRAQGMSGGRTANGTVNADLGSASGTVSGRVGTGAGASQFNLDLSNLGGNVQISGNRVTANVRLGSVGVSNTTFAGSGLSVALGRGGRLNGLNVSVELLTNATGIASVTVRELNVTRFQVEEARVRWGDYEIHLPHGHIDGINVSGLTLQSTAQGLVPTGGHVGVGQIAIDRLQANLGRDLQASAGGFRGSGMSLDILGNDRVSFRLAEIEARAVGARGASGRADLEWLNARGISFDGGAGGGDVRVGSASFGVSAQGQGSTAQVPGSAASAGGVTKRWELPFLDTLGGQVGLSIPLGGDRVSGALVVDNGRARIGPTLSSIHLPHEQYWGWAPAWLVRRMVTEAAGYIVDFFNPEFARLRPRVETWLANDGRATPATPGFELNAQTMSSQLVSRMGGWSAMLDVASPTGPGVLRTAQDAVATWLTERDPLGLYGSSEAARESAQQMREAQRARRVQELVDWVRAIALDIGLAGQGALRGFQNERLWVSSTANASLSARGTLAQQLRLAMSAQLSGLNVDMGSLQVHADTARVDASAGAGLSSGGTASGNGGMTGSASGITLRMRR